MRVIFMGTPEFAVPALDALCDAGQELVCVYTQPPRPAGRGKQRRCSPVHNAAAAHRLTVATPKSLRDSDAQAAFADLRADIAVVAAYGLILPKPVLDAPRLGCINIHASLLPRWRGAAPIQRAIMAGDAETGITIMRMDEGLDTGPMLLRAALPIRTHDTAGTLHDRLRTVGAELIVTALDRLAANDLDATPQPDAGATYARKLTREDEPLDWRQDAESLARQIRALSPHPGAWFRVGNDRWKVLMAMPTASPARDAMPGTLVDDQLTIACGQGALRLTRIQRPGKRVMDAAEVLRGHPLEAGLQLAVSNP